MGNGAWNFIDISQAGQPKYATDRITIRRTAMQNFRRQQRLEQVKAFKAECAAQDEVRTGLSTSTRSIPSSENARRSKSRGPQGLTEVVGTRFGGQPSADDGLRIVSAHHCPSLETTTFLGLPKELGYPSGNPDEGVSGLAYLFNYFVSDIIPIMLPLGNQSSQKALQECWSSSLLRDPLILQAAVSHAALHMDLIYHREYSKLAARHTTYAVRLIRQTLASMPQQIDNQVLGAVAMIASNSNITEEMTESHIHMDALAEMVKLGGGKGKLVLDSTTQMLLSWADATSARMARSRPRLTSFPAKLSAGPQYCYPETPIPEKGDIFQIIDELRELSALKAALDTNSSVTISDIVAFDTRRNTLEEHLLCTQHHFITTPPRCFRSQILQICSTATAIYMTSTFRNFRPQSPILHMLKNDLKVGISRAEELYACLEVVPDSDTPYAEWLLWALFLGGGLLMDAAEKTWFAQRISFVLPWTPVRSWQEVEACLERILWVDKLRNKACRALWDEVERLLGFGITKPQTANVENLLLSMEQSCQCADHQVGVR